MTNHPPERGGDGAGRRPPTDRPDDPGSPAVVEVCVGDATGALTALAAGADRVEVCADLAQGGTTPSIGTIRLLLDLHPTAALRVMIRPRGGDFVWDRHEEQVARHDIAAVRALAHTHGRVGFVFGALTPQGALDLPLLRRLREACGPYPATLHKAFDEVADQEAALEQAIELGFDRILTSGGADTALAGAGRLALLHRQAAGRIVIIAGGGIRPANVREVLSRSGVGEVHFRAPGHGHGTQTTDQQIIREVLAHLRGPASS